MIIILQSMLYTNALLVEPGGHQGHNLYIMYVQDEIQLGEHRLFGLRSRFTFNMSVLLMIICS